MTNANKQTAHLPANVAYTFMTPCTSRGRLNAWIYVCELFVAAFLVVMNEVVLTWIAALMATHALYRLMSNVRNFQAQCPHCQTVQKRLTEKTKPFKCKTCGHQLEVFGTKLADRDTPPNAGGPVEYAQKEKPIQPPTRKPQETNTVKVLSGIVSILLVGGWLYYVFGGGLEMQATNSMQEIKNTVAADAVAQYTIASTNGNKMDKCVQAGFVTAAYLQAKDEPNYAHWKWMRDRDCAAAGIPSQ